ncbi:hypothetical protein ABT009_36770 [Streptomyces sp. NPDC002896]
MTVSFLAGTVRSVDSSGIKAEQHAAQQTLAAGGRCAGAINGRELGWV